MSSLVETSLVFVYGIFKSCQETYSPLKESMTLHLNKLETSSSKNGMPQVLLRLVQWFQAIVSYTGPSLLIQQGTLLRMGYTSL